MATNFVSVSEADILQRRIAVGETVRFRSPRSGRRYTGRAIMVRVGKTADYQRKGALITIRLPDGGHRAFYTAEAVWHKVN